MLARELRFEYKLIERMSASEAKPSCGQARQSSEYRADCAGAQSVLARKLRFEYKLIERMSASEAKPSCGQARQSSEYGVDCVRSAGRACTQAALRIQID